MTDRKIGDVSSDQISTQYALQIAVQTMNERCQTLQQRLIAVEEENQTLRQNAGVDEPDFNPENANGRSEVELLRETVAELTRQKSQLAEHIAMVATENRQLWSRLSKLTKDKQALDDSLNKMKNSLATSPNQNLIRSKTFTQNSPNPALRQRNANLAESEDLSLEEISLKVLNEFLEGKAMVEKQYNEYIQGCSGNSIGFGYLNDDAECLTDTKKCLDGMIDLKKEVLRQQSDLKVALSRLRQRKVLELCASCKSNSRKPTMADKNLETDDNITNTNNFESKLMTNQYRDGAMSIQITKLQDSANHIDFLERKRIADTIDKMCPMCGRVYTSSTTFDEFQEHVESHFIDETELDISMDKNFELISHTVGDF